MIQFIRVYRDAGHEPESMIEVIEYERSMDALTIGTDFP